MHRKREIVDKVTVTINEVHDLIADKKKCGLKELIAAEISSLIDEAFDFAMKYAALCILDGIHIIQYDAVENVVVDLIRRDSFDETLQE